MRQSALAALLALAGLAHAADVPTYTLQGSGATSPFVGQTVTTTGVVTRLNSNGFFIQDAAGDGDPTTSDGLFVFTTSFAPAVGSLVRVAGAVVEFNPGAATNPATAGRPLTEMASVSSVTVLASGQSVTPTPVVLPLAEGDTLERFEGMLVSLAGPLTVQQNYFLARYGQLTLGAGGRHENPTNRYRPGAQAQAMAALLERSRILLDDGSSAQNRNPTPYVAQDGQPRAGDRVGSVTGVIDFGLATASNTGPAMYRIHPVAAPVFSPAHPRPATPPDPGGNLRLAAMNVLNYFTTFSDGSTASGQTGQGCTQGGSTSAGNCRGASNLAEFNRQRAKIVSALAALNADAVGLMEIQNNGQVAAQNLVDGLNAVLGAGTYAVVPDPAEGTGTDAIKVALIHKPARLARVGAAISDLAPVNSRPTLAQTFAAANGEKLTLVVNHLKSKGSCPEAGAPDAPGNVDAGDGQGCWNLLRLQQAQRLRQFAAQLQAGSGSPDLLLIGDMNAYGQEDPIHELTSNGFVDQLGRFTPGAYTYVFDGTAGRLDHAIASPALSSKVTGALAWRINADEQSAHDYNLEFKQPACGTCAPDPYTPSPYRSSDHDPVLVGVAHFRTVAGNEERNVLSGTPGDDILIGGGGADLLAGGAGIDLFTYRSMRDAGDVVTDFVPGTDRIDLRALLAAMSDGGLDAVAEGFVRFHSTLGGTSVQVDVDGPTGGAAFRPLLTLRGISPSQLDGRRDLIVR